MKKTVLKIDTLQSFETEFLLSYFTVEIWQVP